MAEHTVSCPDCGGAGSLPVRALDPRPARPCGRCDTTGRVPADELDGQS